MENGAVVDVLSKFVHPPKETRDKYTVRPPAHQLQGCIIIREAVETINCQEQAAIIFTNNDFLMPHYLLVADI